MAPANAPVGITSAPSAIALVVPASPVKAMGPPVPARLGPGEPAAVVLVPLVAAPVAAASSSSVPAPSGVVIRARPVVIPLPGVAGLGGDLGAGAGDGVLLGVVSGMENVLLLGAGVFPGVENVLGEDALRDQVVGGQAAGLEEHVGTPAPFGGDDERGRRRREGLLIQRQQAARGRPFGAAAPRRGQRVAGPALGVRRPRGGRRGRGPSAVSSSR